MTIYQSSKERSQLQVSGGQAEESTTDVELESCSFPQWEHDPENPWNWPTWKKVVMVVMISSQALTASITTSIISPSRTELMDKFSISSTEAILPVTLYTIALGFGPIVGGPLSEIVGRLPVYAGALILGALFTLGAGLANQFSALCVLRFLVGFCWAPVLAVAPGSLAETFEPRSGHWGVCYYRKELAVDTMEPALLRHLEPPLETPHPRDVPPSHQGTARQEKGARNPLEDPSSGPSADFRCVTFICLYVAVEFGTLFSFFAGVPYTFATVYGFSIDDAGLLFLTIVIGCLLGLLTIVLCDFFLYRKQAPRYASNRILPEYRLYPALFGSVGLPVGLFWFAWSARPDVHWLSPAAAIVPFAWGNLGIFISTVQYFSDTYQGNIVASVARANSLARYGFAGVFPRFTLQVYQKLGVHWAASLLGFLALELLPVPWPKIRSRSMYPTIEYAKAMDM
ncbi:hypothetical protein TGAM01_v205898 [Trichoderma gamsii]|uniref:Major facilitator superfamily (MFS) profile domain-containing protein n=1 Tax=Trichoderma gamsii TaxID=398673 RepID=A0A2P4ZLP0_9HYPO|nr:hypothetical protein TGAM01_v205898 [Trichoderma gamsii]PON25212.1 hypothetical protein TGAM01_v205898 [Trichoderma gamsii]